MRTQFSLFATSIAILTTIACGSSESWRSQSAKPNATANPAELSLATPTAYAPTLGATPWPTIHQNDRGTKEGGDGPLAPKTFDRYTGTDSILMTVGNKYLYHQGLLDTKIRLFDPKAVKSGPIREFDLGNPWPVAGGGNIDQYGNSWWTGGSVLIRLNEDITKATYSGDLLKALPAGATPPTLFNSVNFLSDGTVLVSTMQEWAFLIDPTPAVDGKFPVRSAVSKLSFTYRGEQIIKETDSYGPRPIIDTDGGIYLVSSHALAKITYNKTSKSFDREALWMFRNPQNLTETGSNMAVSNPVVVGPYVCTVTDPEVSTLFQEVYCLDRQTGELKHRFQPFDKPDISAAHTLGAIEATQELFVIADDSGDKGGVAGFSLKTGKKLWPNVPLKKVSDSLVLSASKRRLYVTASGTRRGTIDLHAVDIDSGATKVIDTILTLRDPLSSLGAIDANGSLFFPLPGGFTRYHD